MDRVLMQYLVISDIHANLEALEAAIAAAPPCDHVLVLGDLVGYGADPNAVVDRIRAFPAATIIRGNHDKVAAGLEDATGFNHLARHAVEWTRTTLTDGNRDWIAALPTGPIAIDALAEICHGTPFDEDVYLFDDMEARRAFRAMQRPLCLFGHTHVPTVFRCGDELEYVGPPRGARFDLTVDSGSQYLVNCGAVGQPRDGDPRAAFGVLDTEAATVRVLRVPYDLSSAQSKIIAAGLPEVLAQRLGTGR
jgi:diadenosine tetraphosphatase ApaH/serine/threonine PP2A family protein phosphatase